MQRSKEINQEKKIINWVTNILRSELKGTPNALPGKKVSLFQEKSLYKRIHRTIEVIIVEIYDQYTHKGLLWDLKSP